MNREVGTIDRVSGGVVIADGTVAKPGQRVWTTGTNWGKPLEYIIDQIQKERTLDAITGKLISERILICEGRWSISPERVYSTSDQFHKIEIAKGRFVGLGDEVWLWRQSGSAWGLVKKKVCAIKEVQESFLNKEMRVQCTYLDNFWPRKENPKDLFASEQEAKDAWPNRTKQLEIALLRAGKQLAIA